jgi:hypothetical protein
VALYSATWLAAVGVATGIGIASVEAVGDAARGRGPLGPAVEPRQRAGAAPPPGSELEGLPNVTEVLHGEYGAFEVTCRGPYALGESVEPADGWRAISFEPGPDDDVDALFARGDGSLEVEVFCNRGRPTLADVEHNEFAGEWAEP